MSLRAAFGFRASHALVCLSLALAAAGCSEPYRVGEYVLVEWEEGKLYPAYIVEISGKAKYRVHFEGYDSRWDEDFGIERIKGRVEGPVVPPPPPEKVARASRTPEAPAASAGTAARGTATPNPPPAAAGQRAGAQGVAASPVLPSSPSPASSIVRAVNQYKPGDRVRVTWRGSLYSAIVLEIVAQDRVLVHYEGHENVWDETVQTDRIVSRRQ